ncbi:MAG: helix-turn-helix domain-containing protein [Firmicutes bacterium]|nr:helix-turn-helix domain-containing protein [Bacillota bacterium]
MTLFSERISLLLSQKKLSQKELALKARVTESAISYYVKGERVPRGEVLSRIANALNCSTDYLLGNTKELSTSNGSEPLQYLQRNLSKLDPEQLKKAENILKAAFDDLFEDEEE